MREGLITATQPLPRKFSLACLVSYETPEQLCVKDLRLLSPYVSDLYLLGWEAKIFCW